MQSLLTQLSIKYKLLLFIALPVLLILWLASGTLWQLWQTSQQATEVALLVSEQRDLNRLLNALQRERGATGVLLTSKGQTFTSEVASARQDSDRQFQALDQIQQQRWQALWQQVAALRQLADQLQIAPPDAAARYTALIVSLLDRNSERLQGLSDVELLPQLMKLNQWVELIERAGRERALLSMAFTQRTPSADLLARIHANQGAFESLKTELLRSGGNEQQVLQQAASAGYQDALQQLAQLQAGAALTLAPAEWFRLSTERIGVLIGHQQQLSEQILQLAQQKRRGSQRQFWLTTVLLTMALLLTGWLSLATNTNIRRAMGQLNRVMKQLSARDLTARSQYLARDEFGQIGGGINLLAGELQEVLQQIALAGERLAAAAEQASMVTAQTCAGVAQQQQDTEMAATAMHQMSATVADVAQSTADAASQADAVQRRAAEGQQQLDQTTGLIEQLCAQVRLTSDRLGQLNEHSQNISQVLDVIRNIADQTNLLALNAAIEAARAGDHGRGFAVVADEVRTLAQRTQQSTVDIQKMIETLQQGAKAASEAMLHSLQQAEQSTGVITLTGTLLKDVTAGVALIHDKAAQIASAAEQQSMVAGQINENITRISDVSQHTSSGAQETAATAADLARLAEQLQGMILRFRLAT